MGEKRVDLELTQDASDVGSIERLCEQFEAAAKDGEFLSIEDLLTGWEEPERSKLLSELLLIELQYASQRGETLGPSIFESRFPEHRQVVKDIFDRWFGSQKMDTVANDEDTVDMRSQFGQLRLHAEGGLGMVFRADDRQLSREVALKFIRSNLAADSLSRERFQLEAEITSRLEHPGIVPVYGLGGTSDGDLFYAMRFIQGETLEEFIDRYHEAADEPKEDHERRFANC